MHSDIVAIEMITLITLFHPIGFMPFGCTLGVGLRGQNQLFRLIHVTYHIEGHVE